MARAIAWLDTGEVSTMKTIPSTAKVMIAAFSVATEDARTAVYLLVLTQKRCW